jgi:hypothetical protein
VSSNHFYIYESQVNKSYLALSLNTTSARHNLRQFKFAETNHRQCKVFAQLNLHDKVYINADSKCNNCHTITVILCTVQAHRKRVHSSHIFSGVAVPSTSATRDSAAAAPSPAIGTSIVNGGYKQWKLAKLGTFKPLLHKL